MIGALAIGFLGSLHCLGMCGPLLMSMPLHNRLSLPGTLRILIYHSGRFAAYGLIGLAFGILGAGLKLLVYQQWLSIIAGVLMLLWVASHYSPSLNRILGGMNIYQWLRQRLQFMVRKNNVLSNATLGVLNGFLPCGLVYLAATSSILLASPAQAALYMMLFGLGTAPALLLLTFGRSWFTGKVRFSVNRWIPIMAGVMAIFFILRGSGLGIPYLSPDIQMQQHPETHQKAIKSCCTPTGTMPEGDRQEDMWEGKH